MGGRHQISLSQLAQSSVTQTIEFEVKGKGEESGDVPYLTFKAEVIFDEIFPWQLKSTDWTGQALKPSDEVHGVPVTSDPYVKFKIPRAKRPYKRGYRYGRKVHNHH